MSANTIDRIDLNQELRQETPYLCAQVNLLIGAYGRFGLLENVNLE